MYKMKILKYINTEFVQHISPEFGKAKAQYAGVVLRSFVALNQS